MPVTNICKRQTADEDEIIEPKKRVMKASRQTRLKLKKGFHNAPISYRVLMVAQFTDADKKIIAKGLIKATTPHKAYTLLPGVGNMSSKWTITQISHVGTFDVQALKYKGLEVAVFWKRQTSEVIPAPSDPVPEGVVEHPDDVYVRFDLIFKSARQLTAAVASDLEGMQSKDIIIDSQNRVIEDNDKTIKSLRKQIEALQAHKKPVRKKA